MTKKDYELLAGAIHDAYIALSYASTLQAETKRSLEHAADQIAVRLQNENPRFDYDRFIQACGIK